MTITYNASGGAATAGTVLVPHRHSEGKFVVSPDRIARNYERHDTAKEAFAAGKAKGRAIRRFPGKGWSASLIKLAGCQVA